jgi:hypothetical protein
VHLIELKETERLHVHILSGKPDIFVTRNKNQIIFFQDKKKHGILSLVYQIFFLKTADP